MIKITSLLFLCNIVRKKYICDDVDFLHADKHESMLRSDSMILTGIVKHSQNSQKSKFVMSLQNLKKGVRDEVNFVRADKHELSYKLI